MRRVPSLQKSLHLRHQSRSHHRVKAPIDRLIELLAVGPQPDSQGFVFRTRKAVFGLMLAHA